MQLNTTKINLTILPLFENLVFLVFTQSVKNVIHCSWDDSSFYSYSWSIESLLREFVVVHIALHGVGLSCTCLAISKNAYFLSSEYGAHVIFNVIEYVLLTMVFIKYSIKDKVFLITQSLSIGMKYGLRSLLRHYRRPSGWDGRCRPYAISGILTEWFPFTILIPRIRILVSLTYLNLAFS